MFTESGKIKNAGLTEPSSVYQYNNLIYGDDPFYQSLDIYTPDEAVDQTLPTIISVHGGGFVYGTKEDYRFYCMDLARRGFKVVNFSYRLAPEHKFPAQIEDTNQLFKWVYEHAAEYHLDLNNLFAVGDSAGGSILGIYAALISKPDLNARYDLDIQVPDMSLKAIALNCGLYDPARQNPLQDGTLVRNCMHELFTGKGTPHELDLIKVASFIHKHYPPTYLVTSDHDFLREQPRFLIKSLEKKEIPFIYRYFTSKKKSLDHVFHLNIKLKESQICSDAECNFFREFIEYETENDA